MYKYNKEYSDNYRNANREKINLYYRTYYKNKIAIDPEFKLKINERIKLARHKKIISNGIEIKKVGRPVKNNI